MTHASHSPQSLTASLKVLLSLAEYTVVLYQPPLCMIPVAVQFLLFTSSGSLHAVL